MGIASGRKLNIEKHYNSKISLKHRHKCYFKDQLGLSKRDYPYVNDIGKKLK